MDDQRILELLEVPATREKGFEVLLRRENDYLYRVVCRTVRDEVVAEDLLQEVWIKVWDRLHQFRKESSLKTWLRRVALNHCLDHLRKEKRLGVLRKVDDLHPSEQPRQGHELPETELLENTLMAALATLPDKQRLAFEMRYFDDLPYEEISEVLGTSVGGLKANYHFAAKKIKEQLLKILNPENL